MLTKNQIDAAVRYATAAVSSIAGIAGVSAFLQTKGVNVQQVLDTISGLGQLGAVLLGLAGTIGTLWAGIKGVTKANPVNQSASVSAAMADQSISVEQKQQMVTNSAAALATATTQGARDLNLAAKVAALDVAAAIPEVVGNISVTSKDLAANTNSDQVRAT